MSKLDSIRQLLNNKPELVWNEHSAKFERLRQEGSFYYSIAIQVAPKEPILIIADLKEFSEKLSNELAKIGTDNITKCYNYSETKHDVIKTATLYYSEEIDSVERRIAVTIYPCQVMSENMGIRGVIEVKHYECPDPCEQSKECSFYNIQMCENSFFSEPVKSSVEVFSLYELLNGYDNFLELLESDWQHNEGLPSKLLHNINQYILINKNYFDSPEMKPIKRILDYVYTVV